MNTIAAKTFFLVAIAITAMKAGNGYPPDNNVKPGNDFKEHTCGIHQFLIVKQGRPDSTAEEKLAKRLADELNSIGVEVNKKEVDALAGAMTKDGQGAVAFAMMISTQIAKLKISQPDNGGPSSKKTNATLKDVHIDSILQNCKKDKNAKLALTQIIVPKLILLKEKNKKANNT